MNMTEHLPHLFSCIAIFPALIVIMSESLNDYSNLDVLFLSFPLFVGGDIRSCSP